VTDHSLQRTCLHQKAKAYRSTHETEGSGENRHEFTLIHMHCPQCGMFFARHAVKKESEYKNEMGT
jgi:hypothetical protein